MRGLPAWPALFLGLAVLSSEPFAQADVTGRVILAGAPNSKDETFFARSAGCGESPIRHTENWKIGPEGELADVVVWIVDPKFSVPPPPVPESRVTQLGCRYEPHVVAVQAASPFLFINGDKTLHNIRARTYHGAGQPGEDFFNFGQSYQGQKDERTFDQPGIYTLECNVHSWMQAWVMALPAPACFAVTGLDGTFSLPAGATLVDGSYTIRAWHPRFAQPLEQLVQVKGGVALINLKFDGTKSF